MCESRLNPLRWTELLISQVYFIHWFVRLANLFWSGYNRLKLVVFPFQNLNLKLRKLANYERKIREYYFNGIRT